MTHTLSSRSGFVSLHSGGQHVACSPWDPGKLIARMSSIWDVEEVFDVNKQTTAMRELVSHLRRLSRRSPTPKGGLCFGHVCCDISEAWNKVCAGGKAQVLAGFSAKGGTLVLAFAPTDRDTCVVELHCKS